MIPWFVYVPMVGGAVVVIVTTAVWAALAVRLIRSRTKPSIRAVPYPVFPSPDSRGEVVEGEWRWVD